MDEEIKKKPLRGPLFWLDNTLKKYIPNFNARAILYLSVIFATIMYIQIWRFGADKKTSVPEKPQETVVADQNYWESAGYISKIQNQTVESFTQELKNWLDGKDQEFTRRKFEDMFFINPGLRPDTGGDLAEVVPESFNYLENHAKARYTYAKEKGFLSDAPALIKLGTIVCNIDANTEQVTSVDLHDWRYASMPKLAEFMNTKPDWKMPQGDKILDISDPQIEDKSILKNKNANTQPAGLFSYLIFHNTKSNTMSLADSHILELNGIDAKLTLARLTTKWDKEPKIYFLYGFEGCKQLSASTTPIIPYGQSN